LIKIGLGAANQITYLEMEQLTQMMLQSENEMGNWSNKSTITNGIAKLKLNFLKKIGMLS
jgi:hypothetical protein